LVLHEFANGLVVVRRRPATEAEVGALLILSLILSLALTHNSDKPILQNKAKTEVPTLELILDKHIQALGGRLSLEKVNSRAPTRGLSICQDVLT
jgi:hypothetical protein